VRAIVVDAARFVVCATVSGVARIWRWGHRGIFGCQTMHNFVYLAQRRSQEFSCEPNFGGRDPCPLLAAPVATVCLSVGHTGEPRKSGRTDRDEGRLMRTIHQIGAHWPRLAWPGEYDLATRCYVMLFQRALENWRKSALSTARNRQIKSRKKQKKSLN